MAMQWLERELKKNGSAQDRAYAEIIAGVRKARGQDIPLPHTQVAAQSEEQIQAAMQELDLRAEWQRQAERYVESAFHAELGLSEEDYLASLPKFAEQPENFRNRFDTPVLVETRINSARQAELAGLGFYLGGLSVADWKDSQGYKTPDAPYATWMQDGKKNLGRSVRDVRATLGPDERGATLADGIALYITHPEILKDHYVDLPGTSVGSAYAPFLCRWDDRPEVDCSGVGYAASDFGSASCGREISS
ncbi:MAG TPA: hypothetical protein VLF68_00335 [Candidatus Saccharimonadales bacterium]|nr:hypothetical protein [Candidatus Saccharimonadales bacterium]